jgi:GT2 family glycosyltransferase
MDEHGWTAVVVNYNGAVYLGACLQALERCRPAPADIVVVDNASTDDSLQELHGFPRVNVLAQPRNLGFAGGANVGLAAVESPYALLMNPDVEVEADFGANLMAAFDSDAALGVAGALLLYPDSDRIQHAGGIIERPLMTTRHAHYGESVANTNLVPISVDFVTGGAMGLRMSAFRAVAGFDERFSPVYYEDVDLCVRLAETGWDVRFIPSLRAIHHEGVTLKQSDAYFRHLHRNRLRFALKCLSPHEWRTGFVPAEIARIRYELSVLHGAGWKERSGAAAIETTLRGVEGTESWDDPSLLPELPAAALQDHLQELRVLWDVPGEISRGPVRSRLHRVIDRLFSEQRAFNGAVVRAFERQDRLNQEQIASVLLIALDLLERLRVIEPETSAEQEA